MPAPTCPDCRCSKLDCATVGSCERRAALQKRWPMPWGQYSGWWGDGLAYRGWSHKGRPIKPDRCDVCGEGFRIAGPPGKGSKKQNDRGDSIERAEWHERTKNYRYIAHTRCVGALCNARHAEQEGG